MGKRNGLVAIERLIPVLLLCRIGFAQYAGSGACRACHPSQFAAQSKSDHAHALALAPKGSPGHWAFGAGAKAITYVSQADPDFYLEHGLSYYASTKAMGPTPGHSNGSDMRYRTFDHATEIEGKTIFSGWRDACLFAFRAESERNAESSNAWKAWTDRRWQLPRIGQPNSWGAWAALERSVIGLAWLGRKAEAAALRPLTEEVVLTEVWASVLLSPFRTAAGIAAACAGDWSAAEHHHLTAIHQTDTAPYRVFQPTAREWYATMLLDRNGPGDAAKARGLLSEALAMYESMGMPFHASRVGGSLATTAS